MRISDWSSDVCCSDLSVGSTTTFTRAAGSFIDDGFQAGDSITSSGFTTGGNNGTFTIDSVAALTITITAASLTIEAGDGGERILADASNVLNNGITHVPLSIEKKLEQGGTHVLFRSTGKK